MDESRLDYLLLRVRYQLQRYDVSRWMTRMWWVAAVVAALMWWGLSAASIPLLWPVRIFIVGMSVGVGLIVWLARIRWSSAKRVAYRVEGAYPDLNWKLLTVVDHAGDIDPSLKKQLVRELWQHGVRHQWPTLIPAGTLWKSRIGNLLGAIVCFTLLGVMNIVGQQRAADEAQQLAAAVQPLPPGAVQIEPGDTDIEKGTSLIVTARFARTPSTAVELVATSASGERISVPMRQVMKEDYFSARLAELDQSLDYRVVYDSLKTEDFHVNVFEYPELKNAAATLDYPDYTKREEERIEDVRKVAAVEGTGLELELTLNKPVASAKLVSANGAEVQLERSASTSEPVYVASWPLKLSERYQLVLIDEAERRNKWEEWFQVQVLPNMRPRLEVVWPQGDATVSPIEEFATQAKTWDDFGLVRAGVTFQLAGGDAKTMELAHDVGPEQQQEVAHQILLEDLAAEPDQLLVYHFWAEDFGPQGEMRRTMGPLKFAEVRPFEEIFRESESSSSAGQQQQGGQMGGQGGQQTEEMLEVQKQILSATWNLVYTPQPGDAQSMPSGAGVIREAQQMNLERAEERAEELDDPQAAEHLQQAVEAMQRVLTAVTAAESADPKSSDAEARLQEALLPEQQAYDYLLKLRQREYEVQRGQNQSSSSSGGGGSARAQRQLRNMELRQDQDRYETERSAQTPAQQAASEQQRDVMDRLRDLARRQQDLNDQIQQLQVALQEADQQQRQELERMLKRLQEQQQQMLRDAEQLQMDMNRPESRESLSQQRSQLQQTRQNLQQASEALREGQLPQALTSGTRAREQLEDMREEIQQQTSNQFSQEMRDLMQRAEEVEQRQQELGEQLQQGPQTPTAPPTLRDEENQTPQPSELADQQQQAVDELLTSMQELVKRAESSQKLLAQDLYDTWRQAQQDQLPQRLDQFQQMLEQEAWDVARRQQSSVDEGVGRLVSGVQQAAEKVLANDAEALRRARSELEGLAEELQRELQEGMRRNGQQTGGEEGESPSGEPGDRGQETENGQPGQQDPSRQPGENGQQAQQGQEGASGQPGENGQPSEANQADQNREQGENSGQGQPGQTGQQGENGQSGQADQQPQDGSPQPNGNAQGGGSPARDGGQQDGQARSNQQPGGTLDEQPRGGNRRDTGGPTSGGGNPIDLLERIGSGGPITGDDFTEWVDRLREVEDLLPDADLRAEASRVRERAMDFRREWRRHSREPEWDLLRDEVLHPLVELRAHVHDELMRHTRAEDLVPLDRDPVPPQFIEPVRRYYERLGDDRAGAAPAGRGGRP